ncbi:site-specific DNA-methyltransferase [Ancylobacter sp. Lp-2]|uniref:DNA methyltransferase n=1 Tax=Ancylobacter sp. Lp-2 TaxID=2881339 RepID=UPI00351CF997|nr:site-specific DNA-methyltransferase [Ancylobacter sp. Lp-2]
MPDQLVRLLIERFGSDAEYILDPFAGVGTTFRVASEFGISGVGFEPDPRLYDVCRLHQSDANVFNDVAQNATLYDLPLCDLMLTSPPFEEKSLISAVGASYLVTLMDIFSGMRRYLRRDAHVLVECVNIRLGGVVTRPLISQYVEILSKLYIFLGEFVVCESSENFNLYGYQHTTILIFVNSKNEQD